MKSSVQKESNVLCHSALQYQIWSGGWGLVVEGFEELVCLTSLLGLTLPLLRSLCCWCNSFAKESCRKVKPARNIHFLELCLPQVCINNQNLSRMPYYDIFLADGKHSALDSIWYQGGRGLSFRVMTTHTWMPWSGWWSAKLRHGCDHSSSVVVKAEASLCMFGSGTPFLLRIRHHGIP